MNKLKYVVVCALLSVGATGALADFAGQTILGPLSDGSIVSDTTLGKSDDNDGFDSGGHLLNIWDGGDDVYLLNWTGGDMTVTLDSFGGSDNDLFVYSPGALDSTGDYSITNVVDVVTLPGAAAGDYYINVDSTFFSEGDYRLAVTPEPGTLSLLVLGGLLLRRRRA
jgi:hypothetical protein